MWIILIVVVVNILLSIIVGLYADEKGKSFILFVLLSIILTPLLGFILALIVSDDKAIQNRHKEMLKATSNKSTKHDNINSKTADTIMDIDKLEEGSMNDIKSEHSKYEAGIIAQEEFIERKRKILDSLNNAKNKVKELEEKVKLKKEQMLEEEQKKEDRLLNIQNDPSFQRISNALNSDILSLDDKATLAIDIKSVKEDLDVSTFCSAYGYPMVIIMELLNNNGIDGYKNAGLWYIKANEGSV